MKLRKFFGLTSRSVLEQIRAELGPDAVIVANHPTPQGVEISALAGDAMDSLLSAPPAMPRRATSNDAEAAELAAMQAATPARRETHEAAAVAPMPVDEPVIASMPAAPLPPVPTLEDAILPAPAIAAMPAAAFVEPPAVATPAIDTIEEPQTSFAIRDPLRDDDSLTARLMREVAAMRGLLEGQLAQLAWSDAARRSPVRAQLTQDMIAFGYSPALAREMIARLPDDYSAAQAQQWLLNLLTKSIACVDPADEIVVKGGVYALVGPTGVGKTTTCAKLAARCAVRHGSASLALLTTDSYRVGAQDQLRIYAKILGVTVQTVNDARDLRHALDSLRGKHLVLIDTVGMSQRDARVAEHASILDQPEVRRLLLLNAASQGETLEEVVTTYSAGAEGSLDGCIISKQDESARPGQVLDVIIRHRLKVHYVSNGQRVPEDLQAANAGYLAHRSFKPVAPESPFRLTNDEVPLVLAGAGAAYA